MAKDILIVDDEDDIRALMKAILEDEGYQVREAANSAQALDAVAKKVPDLAILDIWLQESDKDGLEVLKKIKQDNPILPVLMISGHGTIETAVTAIQLGAYDFIEKPFKSDRLLMMMTRALETAELKKENQSLKAQKNKGDHELIGNSTAITQLKSQIEKIAPSNSRVLITGEGGTGKEVVAKTIHKLSVRKDNPFMALNCAALHPERLEEELFGVLKDGTLNKGVLELANNGTLFLDEVADMPLETQAKILRVLQDNKIHPVGTQDSIDIDVRILASTNKDLQEVIKEGNFREDLYYRLNVVTLHIPPLSQRTDDIQPLINHFLKSFAEQTGQAQRVLAPDALAKLQAYQWPGNVRQLKNMMEWITIMTPSPDEKAKLTNEDLPPEFSKAPQAQSKEANFNYTEQPLREAREKFEKTYLSAQIKRFNGNVSQMAKFIGMERSALHRKLKSLDISLNDDQNIDKNDKVENIAHHRAKV